MDLPGNAWAVSLGSELGGYRTPERCQAPSFDPETTCEQLSTSKRRAAADPDVLSVRLPGRWAAFWRIANDGIDRQGHRQVVDCAQLLDRNTVFN